MRRRFWLGLVGLGIVLVVAAWLVVGSYLRPPLAFAGGTVGIRGAAGDEVPVGWNLRNTGWFPARITEVTIRGYEGAVPIWVTGAVGTHWLMVGSGMPRIPEANGYILRPLGEFTVPPERALPQWEPPSDQARTLKAPRLYGLIALYRVDRDRPVRLGSELVIRYRYLGLPRELTIRLDGGE